MVDTKERVERAKALFTSGYNCAQSVFAAFHEEMGIEEKTAFKMYRTSLKQLDTCRI